jgi:hypothetical protein
MTLGELRQLVEMIGVGDVDECVVIPYLDVLDDGQFNGLLVQEGDVNVVYTIDDLVHDEDEIEL